MKSEEYLSVLNPEQKHAVMHEGAPLLILAGAGSGKTRVITTKIAYLISEKNIQPYQILAVTFTKKAAREMLERAVFLEPRASNAQIRTFHSFGAWFLRKYAEEAGIDKNFTVYDDDDMATLVLKSTGLTRQESERMAHKIALAKDFCLTPDSEDLYKIDSSEKFPTIYATYEARLRSTGNVDFGDLIMLPVLILNNNKEICQQMQYRFRVIMVDEYQDSNVAQFKLLEALSGVKDSSPSYVCVVGDDDQSIYKFRGAEVQNILNFQTQFPKTSVIRLERNYRSTSQILLTANTVVNKNQKRLGKTLIAERGNGSEPVLIFCPTQDDETRICANMIEQAREKGCPYSDWAILYRTNAQSMGFESEFLKRKIPYTVVGSLKFYEREEIKDMLAFLSFVANPKDEIAFRRIVNKPACGLGDKAKDRVVEYAREKSESSLLKYSLIDASFECAKTMSKKAKESLIRFATLVEELSNFIGDEKVFSSSTQQVDAEFENASDIEIAQTVPLQLNTKPTTKSNIVSQFHPQTTQTTQSHSHADKKLSEFIEKIANRSGLLEYHLKQDEVSGTQRVLNIEELKNNAVLYPCTREGLLSFLDSIELDRSLAESSSDEKDSVTLITLHNTKGLEFPRVVITGLENGIFPRKDKEGEDLEEERRLFYVGITRAKDQLFVTSCAVRRMFGRIEYMKPSPFLQDAENTFKIIGKRPNSMSTSIDSENLSEEDLQLARKWKKTTVIFHDDYGYGQIIKTSSFDGEFVITVKFENGSIKQFLPKYQENNLMIVRD